MSEAKSIFIYLYVGSPDAAAWMLIFVFVYLANTAVLSYSLTTRGRKWTLTDSERKMNRSEVSSKWNKCRIYVGDQLDRWNKLKEVLRVQTICVCLPRKYGRFMLFIDNNLLLPGARLHILNNFYRKLS
jgi:hypothetical protein